MSEYTKQADRFLEEHGLKFSAKFISTADPLWGDGIARDCYRCIISRKGQGVSFKFWQSIEGTEQGETPTPYDLLTCIQKYDPGTFEEFCSEFGYSTYSRRLIYRATVTEWKKVRQFFTKQEIEQLREIL